MLGEKFYRKRVKFSLQFSDSGKRDRIFFSDVGGYKFFVSPKVIATIIATATPRKVAAIFP
jgi:hypothetical protein